MTDFYVLECSAQECVAEFYLNDIPVVRRSPDIGQHYAGQSNHYLIDGLNELSILVFPGPTPADAIMGEGRRARRIASGAKINAALCRYPFGATVGGPSREELLTVTWVAKEDELMVFPRVVTATVDLGELAGRWAWQDAQTLALSEEEMQGLTKALDTLRKSLHAGNPEPFLKMSKTRLSEIAKAYDQPPEKKTKIIRKTMADDSSQGWWGVMPIDPRQFSFRLAGHNRMVQAIGQDWNPVLKEQPDPDGGIAYYDMLFSFLNNAWTITR